MGPDTPIDHDIRWQVVSLAEIATKIGSGATPRGGSDTYLPSRARFALVRSQNVFDRRFDHDGLAFISDEQADGLRGVALEPGDILLNITGDGITFGRACVVPKCVLPACVNQHVSIIRVDTQRADAGYVLSFLTHPDVKSYIESFNAGGSRRAITKGHIESFRLPLPSLPIQRAIAQILGTLDDKIELNRRMNETLEAITRALFKSWFVDFDPVRAKAEDRDPGLPKPLADMFPDSFEDSELGEIPKGWVVQRVDEEFDLTMGQSPPGETYNEVGDGLPFYQGRADFTFRFPNLRVYCTAPTRFAKAGDTLISVRAPVGDINMALEDCAIGRGVAAARHKSRSRSYTHQFMLGLDEVLSRFEAEGTVFGSISKKDFNGLPCVSPPGMVVNVFERLLAPFDSRIETNERESQTLAGLRDTLLPKLISGELRVKHAERMIENAGC
ncbi:MAG: restriction endonuclease subunit S [Pyrinomonadaceae bacterium]|nr:restriction endonuclease subunit S [Pyrinomonadaceae bacterium]